MKRIKAYWESMEDFYTFSKREWVLTLTTCVLAGIVFGVFFGPKKTVTIGSNNGNNSGNASDSFLEEEEE